MKKKGTSCIQKKKETKKKKRKQKRMAENTIQMRATLPCRSSQNQVPAAMLFVIKKNTQRGETKHQVNAIWLCNKRQTELVARMSSVANVFEIFQRCVLVARSFGFEGACRGFRRDGRNHHSITQTTTNTTPAVQQ